MGKNDEISIHDTMELLESYIKYCKILSKFNKRRANFPEGISEDLVRIILSQIHGIECTGKTTGDIKNISTNEKYEVKCFTSTGPSSFGPKENWNEIFFVDFTSYEKMIFSIMRIRLSNNDPLWKNIKVNSKETYFDQCNAGKRPRIKYSDIINQLPKGIVKVMFKGKLVKFENNVFFQEYS